METVTERVARGAKLLDTERPGWYTQIDQRKLDMESCGWCTLGQLFMSFIGGVEKLWGLPDGIPDWKQASRHGFDWAGWMTTSLEFPLLTEAWKIEITRRLEGSRGGK